MGQQTASDGYTHEELPYLTGTEYVEHMWSIAAIICQTIMSLNTDSLPELRS